MWRLSEGSVTLCLDAEGRPIKLGQGGYGSVYLARPPSLTCHLSISQESWLLAEDRGAQTAHVHGWCPQRAGANTRVYAMSRCLRVCKVCAGQAAEEAQCGH